MSEENKKNEKEKTWEEVDAERKRIAKEKIQKYKKTREDQNKYTNDYLKKRKEKEEENYKNTFEALIGIEIWSRKSREHWAEFKKAKIVQGKYFRRTIRELIAAAKAAYRLSFKEQEPLSKYKYNLIKTKKKKYKKGKKGYNDDD